MPDVELTWLGHASFRVDSPGGKRLYVDPWLSNPKCPDGEREPERVDIIALTHGHSDHVGESVDLAKRFSPEIVAQVELKAWLGKQGAPVGGVPGPNKGGTVEAAGIRFTLVNAFHSSSSDDGDYLGESCGIVVTLENDTTLYFAGDTCVFGDMQLIGRIYEPDLAILPIGGRPGGRRGARPGGGGARARARLGVCAPITSMEHRAFVWLRNGADLRRTA